MIYTIVVVLAFAGVILNMVSIWYGNHLAPLTVVPFGLIGGWCYEGAKDYWRERRALRRLRKEKETR